MNHMVAMAGVRTVGDPLIVRGHRFGEPQGEAEVLEVRGDDGGPPYLVRRMENDHEGRFFPGADADIEHVEPSG